MRDFEQMVVCKVNNFSERLPPDHWEAIVYEDEGGHKVVGKEEFTTELQAKKYIEDLVEKILKNKGS